MFLFIAAQILLLVMGVWCSTWAGSNVRLPIDWERVQHGLMAWEQVQSQPPSQHFLDTTAVI